MIRTAIKFMHFERSKSVGITIGIVISIFLIGQQLGTLGFLTGLMGGVVESSNPAVADLWVVTNQTQNANQLSNIDISLVNSLKSVAGVKNTYPVVFAQGKLKFDNGQFTSVTLIGSEYPAFIAGPNPLKLEAGNLNELIKEGAFSADFFDKRNYLHPITIGTQVEINGKSAYIAVNTKNARGYGNSYMYSDISNARSYGNFPGDKVSSVIVEVKDKNRIDEVKNAINNGFYGVRAWKRGDFKQTTVSKIVKESNIGLSFGSLVVFAIVSGFFIIGLTLYSSTFDRVKDYGTLKAIGANNSYISKLVILQSFLYAIVGFAVAMILLFAMKAAVAKAGLILQIPLTLVFELLLMTLFISVGGSFFAVVKLWKLEPASVFR